MAVGSRARALRRRQQLGEPQSGSPEGVVTMWVTVSHALWMPMRSRPSAAAAMTNKASWVATGSADHDGAVRHPAETAHPDREGHEHERGPGSAHDRRDEQRTGELHHCRGPKRMERLERRAHPHVGDERHHDKLHPNQRGAGRPDDHVETRPLGESRIGQFSHSLLRPLRAHTGFGLAASSVRHDTSHHYGRACAFGRLDATRLTRARIADNFAARLPFVVWDKPSHQSARYDFRLEEI
jgi:hypothetical protein